MAGEDGVAAEAASSDDHILGAVRPGDGGAEGDEHGADAGVDGFAVELGAGDLADGAVELFGVGEVDGFDGGDGLGGDGVGVELDVHGDAGEDAELGAGVVAVNVGGGVGLGVAGVLGVGEDGGVGGTALHAAEDEVAGAVDDAAEAGDLVAGDALENAGNDRNAAGDGCSVDELDVMLRGYFGEGGAAVGDELLVGGDDGLARGESAREPAFDGLEAAHELDDDVDVGGEDVGDGVGPDGGLRDELRGGGGAFALDAAIEDVGELDAGEVLRVENAGDGAADGAEAEEGDLDGSECGGGLLRRRSLSGGHAFVNPRDALGGTWWSGQ